MSCSRFAIFVMLLVFLIPLAQAEEMDFDNDGYAEIAFVKVIDGSDLRWRALTSSSGYTNTITIASKFGELGNHLAPTSWGTTHGAQAARLSRTSENTVRWSVRDESLENPAIVFGEVKDYILAGGDFNGSGFRDAAIITRSGEASVLTDPFGDNLVPAQVLGGKFPRAVARKGVPFYFSFNGANDILAFIEEKEVRTKKGRIQKQIHLQTLQPGANVVPIRFRGSVKGNIEQVIPVAAADGRDALGVISRNANRRFLTVWTFTGVKLLERSISNGATPLVGNFLWPAGQEFALVQSPTVELFNPFTGESSVLSTVPEEVIPVDAVNVVRFVSPGAVLPGAGLASVCSSIEKVRTGILWKPESEVSDPRGGKPVILLIDGFKTGTDELKIYANNGTEVCNFTFRTPDEAGVNENSDHYYSGWYGGCDKNGAEIAALAQEASGSRDVYFQWKNGSCVGPLNPAGRHGAIR